MKTPVIIAKRKTAKERHMQQNSWEYDAESIIYSILETEKSILALKSPPLDFIPSQFQLLHSSTYF